MFWLLALLSLLLVYYSCLFNNIKVVIMKKFFNLANGIFFLSLFSVIFLTLNLQSGKMGVVIFRNLHLPVDASIVGWLLLLFSYLMSRKHQTKFFARLGGRVALFFLVVYLIFTCLGLLQSLGILPWYFVRIILTIINRGWDRSV